MTKKPEWVVKYCRRGVWDSKSFGVEYRQAYEYRHKLANDPAYSDVLLVNVKSN